MRRTAARYLATVGQKPGNSSSVAAVVAAALKFDPSAERAPWHNGPLFIPSISWQHREARELVGNLIRWHLWAERHENEFVRRQIYTNLQSVTLAGAAGYQIAPSQNTEAWLQSWKQVVGAQELQQILAEQGAEEDYAALIND